MSAPFPRLLADIGGTNARWAYQAAPGAPLQHVASYECSEFASIGAAARHFLAVHGCPPPRALALGVAAAVSGEQIAFVNNPWSFSRAALAAELGVERLLLLNDFAALAMALPVLGDADRQPLGGGQAVAGAPIAVMGPGTGLGVAALAWQDSGHPQVLSGEGGHATLAAGTDLEDEVLRLLRRRFGHVSAERVLSGPGLVNLHLALAQLAGRAVAGEPEPAQIVAGARNGEDAACIATVRLFLDFLAGFAGNLVLSFGALGGLYLGGGILPRLGPLLDVQRFRQRMEDKGRLRGYLQPVPAWLLTAPYPALLGAANALDHLSD
jgi:glucokinase